MKKKLFFALFLSILGISTGWAAHTITGNGSEGTVSVSELSGGQFSSIAAGEPWVLTLDVENPEGKSFNTWGSCILKTGSGAFSVAATDLQLYLCSASNSNVLRAVFSGSDHNITNVTSKGNFQAIITYDGAKGLTIETTNAQGNTDKKEYTLNAAFPAITVFSYGLPTGINVTAGLTKEGGDVDPGEPGEGTREFDCPTIGTTENGKIHFKSEKMKYYGACSKLKFTLTESGAFFSSGAKRMSFDSFVLYNADGNKVNLKAEQFSGNNGKSNWGNMLDGVNNTYCCAGWGDGSQDDVFEIYMTEDLGGAFSFEFVTENTTMNAKAFHIEVLSEYTITTDAPEGYRVILQYDGEIVSPGFGVAAEEFDIDKLTANELLGYTMTKEVDAVRLVATVRYTKADDLKTPAVEEGGKMHFTSDKMYYPSRFNRIRFTLTESDVTYQSGAKRMSFDSFAMCNAKGSNVELQAEQFSGNNSKAYANMLDGVNGIYCSGDWETGSEDDYFEIFPIEDLGGAFSFDFVTENTTMNAKAFRIDVFYEYILVVDAPEGSDVALQYNGEAISAGAKLDAKSYDPDLFTINDIEGYYWTVTLDEAKATVTVKYAEAVEEVNPASVVALAERIGGAGAADKFKFVLAPALNSKDETFVIGSEDGKVLIKGSTISAITTGLGWYLTNHARINIAWNSLNEKSAGEAYADLSNLPLPAAEETHTSDARYRYYLNYCTFGYSMTSWTWKRWQQEIDWMALHGINMPLQIIGLEEVWRKFLTIEAGGKRKYNYTDEEAKAFVAGPAFTAWWGMNNLEGWGGTASDGWGGVQDDAWYARQVTLAHNILDRQRELGMQPVLPGFSGMVPSNFTAKTGVATDDNGGGWGGFVRPYIVDPTANRFAEIAEDYYACLEEVMGESQYYSMDPFHEGGSISSGKYSEAYTAIYDAMEKAKSGSKWVIQQWQWSSNQRLSLNAVPAGRLLVLDLFADGSPAFDGYHGYAPQKAIFCTIPNFGGRSGVMGRLKNLTDNYFHYKAKYASIQGIGTAPEAIEQTPVTYDLLFQLPWMESKPDVDEWIKKYATARYGVENAAVQEAWELLTNSVLNYGADGIQGPVEDVWASRPNLDASPASTWGVTLNSAGGTYTRARRQMLADATYKLLAESEALGLSAGSIQESNYLYDLVEFGGGVMADYAYDLLLGIKSAKEKAGSTFNYNTTYRTRRDAFLALIKDMDTFRGTNLNFRLGKWTQEARDAAAEVTGATTATPDWYEFNNARTIITTWGDRGQNGSLKDYSYRSWQGLLEDYYLPRWQYFFNHGCQGTDYFFFEWNWAHGMVHNVGDNAKSNTRLTEGEKGYRYSREPEGNTVKEARNLFEKYITLVTLSDGVFYAYNYLDNDLSDRISIIANGGETIDLARYFGSLTGAKVTGDFIDGEVTDLSNVPVKAGVSDGTHIGTVTLENGTKLMFAVIVNPPFYGTYHIDYKTARGNAPVFIAYNEDLDNGKNIGYKLLATGTYTADATADKIFTLVPSGEGFSISAQGQYLKAPTLTSWNHLMFSQNSGDAGTYLVEETNTKDVYKLHSTGSGFNYVNDYDKYIFGCDPSSKEDLSTFTFTPVTTYSITVGSAGVATLCLPFNVVLPEGVQAYDCAASDITYDDVADVTKCTMQVVANPGETLKAGTPVVIKAAEGIYDLTITMDNADARTSVNASLLSGNYLKKSLTQDGTDKKFVLQDATFSLVQGTAAMAANSSWMEWSLPEELATVQTILLDFSVSTGIQDIITGTANPQSTVIYNVAGQRIPALQKGVNIVGNRKVVVK